MKNENRKALAEMYTGLVPTVVYAMLSKPKNRRYSMYDSDLLSEGYITLCKSADNYDPRKGVKFETYASLRIRGTVKNMLKKFYRQEIDNVSIDSVREEMLSERIGELKPEVSKTNLIEELEPQNSEMYMEVYYSILLGDETYQSVADKFNTSKGNIVNAKNRLLKKLRKQLEEQGEKYGKS